MIEAYKVWDFEEPFNSDIVDEKTFKWRKIDASQPYRKVITMGIDYLSGLDLSRFGVSPNRCTGIITIQGISNPKRCTSIESCLECFSFIVRLLEWRHIILKRWRLWRTGSSPVRGTKQSALGFQCCLWLFDVQELRWTIYLSKVQSYALYLLYCQFCSSAILEILILTLTFIMKKLFTLLLFLGLTFTSFSQTQFEIVGIYPDSISVLKDCKWELSKAKFRDSDEQTYQVFLDTDLNRIFLIFRKEKKFAKVAFKW